MTGQKEQRQVHKYVNIFHKWQFRTWDGGYMTQDDEHGVSGVEFAL